MRSTGLIFDMGFDYIEPGVVTLYDKSRRGNDGTMTNVTWEQLPSGLWVMVFDGTAKINIPDDPKNDLTDGLTILFWGNLTTYTSFDMWVSKRVSGNDMFWFCSVSAILDNVLVRQGGGDQIDVNAQVNDGNSHEGLWFLRTMTLGPNGNDCDVYENGVYETGDAAYTWPTLTTADLEFGVYSGSSYYLHGKMAGIRIWNYQFPVIKLRQIFETERRLFGR